LVLSRTVSEILQVFVLMTTNFGGAPVGPDRRCWAVGVNLSRYLKLFGCEIIFEVF